MLTSILTILICIGSIAGAVVTVAASVIGIKIAVNTIRNR